MPRRDQSHPITKEEINEMRENYKKLPTYDPERDAISTADIPVLVDTVMNIDRTEDEIKVYIEYWNKHYNGFLPWDKFLNLMKDINNMAVFIMKLGDVYDKNKNGFIDSEEFAEYVNVSVAGEPKLRGLTYEDFVHMADENKDGRVSIQEFGTWISTYLKTH